MLTLLNLLPDEKKLALHKRVRSRFLLWQVVLLFLLEVFYLSVLGGIYIFLNSQRDTLKASDIESVGASAARAKILDQYEGKFRGANEALDVIGKIERNHFYFGTVFTTLESLLPSGITIDRLSTKNYTVLLSGRARTRDDLILLDTRLKESKCLSAVNVPISNLFSQTEIDFQLDFTLKPECLRNKL